MDIDTKEFEVEIGIPSVSALIVKELKIEKGSSTPGSEFVGDLTFDQIIKIARMKKPDIYAKTLKDAVKEILGSCVSIGVKIEGKEAKLVSREVDEGIYDDKMVEEPI